MTQDLQSDRELARGACEGDEASWKMIYESTCQRLFALLVYQVGSHDEARDLLQETYLRAFRSLRTYRGDAPLAAWLRAIALHKAIDWKRGALRRLNRAVPLGTELPADSDPSEHARFDSERRVLSQALAALAPRQRAALLLREWEERSFREVGVILGCSESTARVHHARARARVRRLLDRDSVPESTGDLEGQQV